MDFSAVIAEWIDEGKIPRTMTHDQIRAMRRSMSRYQEFLGRDGVTKAADALINGVKSILEPQDVQRIEPDGTTTTVSEGDTPATVRAKIKQIFERFSSPELAEEVDLDFMIRTSREVSRGASRMIVQNDAVVLDEWPGLEFKRVYSRTVPRGFEVRGGKLISVPDDDWPTRWRHAAAASGDSVALAILDTTGRMCALKSSGIWHALGDGAGGYTDTLGNPYDPIAFNTGFRQEELSRRECVALGLIRADEPARPAQVNWERLFALPESA